MNTLGNAMNMGTDAVKKLNAIRIELTHLNQNLLVQNMIAAGNEAEAKILLNKLISYYTDGKEAN